MIESRNINASGCWLCRLQIVVSGQANVTMGRYNRRRVETMWKTNNKDTAWSGYIRIHDIHGIIDLADITRARPVRNACIS